MQNERIGLFIDAENASHKHLAALVAELSRKGNVVTSKAFGDWSEKSLLAWKDKLAEYAIVPIQQFAYSKGKNAADIALTIDVVDTLHRMQLDAVCIMSSDCDFTPLVTRCTSQNIAVYGAGEQKSAQPFRNACSHFIELPCAQEGFTNSTDERYSIFNANEKRVKETILEAMAVLQKKHGKISLSHLSSELNNRGVNHRDLGFTRFKTMIEHTELFKISNGGKLRLLGG